MEYREVKNVEREEKHYFFVCIAVLSVAVFSGCIGEKSQESVKTEAPTTVPALEPSEVPSAETPATTEPPKPRTVLIEETDSSFKWSDECVIQENPGASGGSWLACPGEGQPPAPGATINVTFTGTAVSVIYITAPYGGIAKVQIDGKTYPEIDMYSEKVTVRVGAEVASGLPNTQHTLSFEVANKRNPSSVDQPTYAGVIVIDAIEVTVPQ